MGGKKNYTMTPATIAVPPGRYGAVSWIVDTPCGRYDFRRWRYIGRPDLRDGGSTRALRFADRDEIVEALLQAVCRLQKTLAPQSLRVICASGIADWFRFLDEIAVSRTPITKLAEIDRTLIERFIEWLRRRATGTDGNTVRYNTARSSYARVRSVLAECASVGLLSRDIFPRNPFPNSRRAYQGYKPYSRDEMRRLVSALVDDLQAIRGGRFDGTESERLTVYFLLIAAKTGRNPTPLLELSRDTLRPHPLKPHDHALLVAYKRRGNNISIQSFRNTRVVQDVASIKMDVASLIHEALDLTERYVGLAPIEQKDRLWLCQRESTNQHRGLVAPLTVGTVHRTTLRFVARHNLKSDEIDPGTELARPLQVTVMRLRKTFARRMWQLTGGDLVQTASMLGNQPRVTDSHYLDVTPEMERNHKFVGLCLEIAIRGLENDPATQQRLAAKMKVSVEDVERVLSGRNNTGVGRCSSPYHGQFAPKNGVRACTAFLSCFRCPNQVIMESDLHRLFSFYWLLIKERNLLNRNRWRRVYGWVIREIDRNIAQRFDPDAVLRAREEARRSPHPMWQDRAILGGENQ